MLLRFLGSRFSISESLKGWARPGPRISNEEYAARRERLVAGIRKRHPPSQHRNLLILLQGSKLHYIAPDVVTHYRQCSNFRYLTGITEPGAIYAMHVAEKGDVRCYLFLDKKTSHEELWEGPSPDHTELVSTSGAVDVLPVRQFLGFLDKTAKGAFLCYDFDGNWNAETKQQLAGGSSMASIKNELHLLRVQKSPKEVEMMRHVCEVGSVALTATISKSKHVYHENEIRGRMELESRRRGAEALAYLPVIAGGPRANTIHYLNANSSLRPTDTVLMDAGCDINGYVSDITRCFPVSGRWSDPQRVVYDALNLVQTNLLHYANNNECSLSTLFHRMNEYLAAAMREAGMLSNKLSDQELLREANALCPHHVSHYLGMDVHDCDTVAKNMNLQPGMAFTIEPGVYIPDDRKNVPKEFRGIGYRIEDDVVRTESGIE
ncbi:unnamed protein product, partial [Mesorhabditis spiculigera]